MALKKIKISKDQPVKAKRESSFTTIQIFKEDKQKLFNLGMEIAIINNKPLPPNPVMMAHHAVHALEDELKIFKQLEKEKQGEWELDNQTNEPKDVKAIPLSSIRTGKKLH